MQRSRALSSAALLVGGGVLWFAGLPKENASAGQLNTRLSAIEAQIREMAQRPQPQPDNRPVEALSQRIAKLEEAASRPPRRACAGREADRAHCLA